MVSPTNNGKGFAFWGVNLALLAFYLALAVWVPSRHVSGRVLLWSLVSFVSLMFVGLTIGGPLGRRVSLAGCLLMLFLEVLFVGLMISSSAFLYGAYGSYGRGASMLGLVIIVISIQFIAMVPALQCAYLFSKRGRRDFGVNA